MAFTEHVQQDQQGYLEPILVAMELGQEILQGNTGDEEQTTVCRQNRLTSCYDWNSDSITQKF